MIRRRSLLLGAPALILARAAEGQTYQPGRAPGFRPGFQFLGGALAALTKLSATDKDPNIVLSADQLSASHAAGNTGDAAVRGTTSRTDKRYFEYRIVAVDTAGGNMSFSVGAGTGAASVNTYVGAAGGSSFGMARTNGRLIISNTNTSTGGDVVAGEIIGVASDPPSGKLWLSRNGVWVLSGNPVAGTNPSFTFTPNTPIFPMLSAYSSNENIAVNFGGTAFAYTPPSGFPAWG